MPSFKSKKIERFRKNKIFNVKLQTPIEITNKLFFKGFSALLLS